MRRTAALSSTIILIACGGGSSAPAWSTDLGATHPWLLGQWADARIPADTDEQLIATVTNFRVQHDQSGFFWSGTVRPANGGCSSVAYGPIRARAEDLELTSRDFAPSQVNISARKVPSNPEFDVYVGTINPITNSCLGAPSTIMMVKPHTQSVRGFVELSSPDLFVRIEYRWCPGR